MTDHAKVVPAPHNPRLAKKRNNAPRRATLHYATPCNTLSMQLRLSYCDRPDPLCFALLVLCIEVAVFIPAMVS